MKDKLAPEASGSSSFGLSWAPLEHHLPPSWPGRQPSSSSASVCPHSFFAPIPLFSETLPAPLSSKRVRTRPFEMKPFEDPGAKPLISYTPGLKLNCEPQSKVFPQVPKTPHRFAEESNTVIETYQSGFSDLDQLVRTLVSEARPIAGDENHELGKSLEHLQNYNQKTSSPTCYMIRFRPLVSF